MLRGGQHRREMNREESVFVRIPRTCWRSGETILNEDGEQTAALVTLHRSWQETLRLKGKQGRSMGEALMEEGAWRQDQMSWRSKQ